MSSPASEQSTTMYNSFWALSQVGIPFEKASDTDATCEETGSIIQDEVIETNKKAFKYFTRTFNPSIPADAASIKKWEEYEEKLKDPEQQKRQWGNTRTNFEQYVSCLEKDNQGNMILKAPISEFITELGSLERGKNIITKEYVNSYNHAIIKDSVPKGTEPFLLSVAGICRKNGTIFPVFDVCHIDVSALCSYAADLQEENIKQMNDHVVSMKTRGAFKNNVTDRL